MEKIFVTGATGFVGSNLIRRLVKEGKEVTAFIMKDSDHPFLHNLKIKKVIGDITDLESIRRGIQGSNFVYHTASLIHSPFYKDNFDAFYSVNITGTKNVLDAALECGVEKLVYTSTSSVFGISENKGRLLDEDSIVHPDRLKNNMYAYTKRLAELEVLKTRKKGLDAVIVNLSKVNGKGDHLLKSSFLIKNAYENRVLVVPPGGRGVVSVEDAVEGHLLAMERGRAGESYILSNENMEYIDIVNTIVETLNVKRLKIKIPGLFFYPLYLATMPISLFNGHFSFLNLQNIKEMFGFQYLSSEKARNELGWEPRVSFKTSIKEAFDYCKSKALI